MASKSELRRQFCAVTGASEKTAAKLLESHQYDLQRASDAYFSTQQAVEDPQLVNVFNKYKETETTISIDGTLAYLQDLGLEPEDLRSLTVAYLLGSLRMGEFDRAKFISFWSAALGKEVLEKQKQRVEKGKEGDSVDVVVESMQKVVDTRHQQILQDAIEFSRFYNYCFDFIRSSDCRIKSISSEEAIEYWRLLFSERATIGQWPIQHAFPRLEQWYEFLQTHNKPVSKDLWVMFLKFLSEVVVEDPINLRSYDEMSSWPSVIDEYVEWLRECGLLVSEQGI